MLLNKIKILLKIMNRNVVLLKKKNYEYTESQIKLYILT